jgi:hypothetical protein
MKQNILEKFEKKRIILAQNGQVLRHLPRTFIGREGRPWAQQDWQNLPVARKGLTLFEGMRPVTKK